MKAFRLPVEIVYPRRPILKLPTTIVGKYTDDNRPNLPHVDDLTDSIAAFTGLGSGGVELDPRGEVFADSFLTSSLRGRTVYCEYGERDVIIYDGRHYSHRGIKASDHNRYFIAATRKDYSKQLVRR